MERGAIPSGFNGRRATADDTALRGFKGSRAIAQPGGAVDGKLDLEVFMAYGKVVIVLV